MAYTILVILAALVLFLVIGLVAGSFMAGGTLLKLSVIIAAYNEERTVATIVERVRSVPLEIEIIAVNRFNLFPPPEIVFRPSPSAATD